MQLLTIPDLSYELMLFLYLIKVDFEISSQTPKNQGPTQNIFVKPIIYLGYISNILYPNLYCLTYHIIIDLISYCKDKLASLYQKNSSTFPYYPSNIIDKISGYYFNISMICK